MISAVSAPFVQPLRPPANSLAVRETASSEAPAASDNKSRTAGELTPEEKEVVEQLKKTDQEVRAHEQAHKNAGGKFAGSASFSFQSGPDGKQYAVSGEVPIDIAPVEGDPAATIAKMTTITAAALAPAKPSGQDRQVAARAAALRVEAQAELASETRKELSGEGEDVSGESSSGNIAAFAAYEAGRNTEKNEKISGNILDFIS